ncbi:MAG: ATP-dependent DNA helicase [Thermacetogeniaceae bacterium]
MDIRTPVERIFREVLPARLPSYELREQQIEVALKVEKALRRGANLLAEAGTGTGKSFAYLIPVALDLEENGGRAIVSTATIALQEQLLRKDIPLLEEALGIDLGAELAKGKGNYLCLVKFIEEIQTPTLFADAEVLKRLQEWSEETETGDKSELPFELGDLWNRISTDDACLGRKCHLYKECFYFKARNRLQQARLIICNHALFFVDLSMRGNGASLLPDYHLVVFDEAHHIEDVARNTMSTKVSAMRLPVLLYQLRKREGCNLEAVQRALALNEEFFAVVSAAAASENEKYLLPRTQEIAKLGEDLRKAVEDVVLLFDPDCAGEREQALFDCLGRYNADLQEILETGDPGKVYWVEKARSGRRVLVTLHATPIDVSGYLAENLFENEQIASVIMTSATLSLAGDFSYFKSAVGCEAADEIAVESPFDYMEQCILYMPEGLPDPKAEDFHERVIPFIEEILRKTRGRAFVLFTSYRGLNQAYDLLAPKLPWRVLRQGEKPKQKLLEEFKEDIHSVLFATASFWEGVDVQGEALSCVILVKLPFAVPDDPITEARMAAIERSGGNAFLSYSLPEAVIRLRQGFGRLIRTQQDRGIVAILDPRIKTKWYGSYFLKSLPRCREVSTLDEVDIL